MLRLRAEFEGNQVLGTGPQPTADIVARDDKIAATIIHAADDQMHMRVVGVPVIHGDQSRRVPRSTSIRRARSRVKAAQVFQLGGILGRDDEAEMVAVVLASCCEARSVEAVGLGIEEQAPLPVPADPVATQIGEMGRERGSAIGFGPCGGRYAQQP